MSVPSGLQVFVNQSGDDTTGQLQNVALPYKTFTVAIAAIISSSNPGPWVIIAGPGLYFEDVIVPIGVNIFGANAQTTIIGSLTMNGGPIGGVLTFIVVASTNKPALTISAGHVSTVTCFFSTTWNNNSTNQSSVLINAGSSLIPTSTGAFSSTTGAPDVSSIWLNYGELDLDQCMSEYSITGPVKMIAIYNNAAAGSLLKMQQSSTKVTANVTLCTDIKRIFVIRNDSGTSYVIGHRAEIFVNTPNGPDPKKPSRFGLLQVIGNSTNEISWSSMGFGSNMPLNTLVYAEGICSVSGKSSLGAYGTQFYTSSPDLNMISGTIQVPAFVGKFKKLFYTGIDQAGSIVSSGGIALKTTRVKSSYDVQPDDSTVLIRGRKTCEESQRNIKISLPDPKSLKGISITEGRIVTIKNAPAYNHNCHHVHTDTVKVIGQIADGEIILHPGKAVTLQIIKKLWYVISFA